MVKQDEMTGKTTRIHCLRSTRKPHTFLVVKKNRKRQGSIHSYTQYVFQKVLKLMQKADQGKYVFFLLVFVFPLTASILVSGRRFSFEKSFLPNHDRISAQKLFYFPCLPVLQTHTVEAINRIAHRRVEKSKLLMVQQLQNSGWCTCIIYGFRLWRMDYDQGR